ncbi:TolB family protein [Saccharothrix obliqua]|uniref:TolB family protein n=1 Tax=Saccharothrix obliqua TaxID=2861747 RepID=UPI001C5D91B7|nr:hypothetical protein [Saccharothrix obliqua]MBW4715562.1 hypothetical protein [Saccharothrix obliqua]
MIAAITGIATAGFAAQPATASPQESEAVSPARFTRLDTDATGNPESAGGEKFIELSGNSRYALFAVHSNSNMVPEQYRTDRELGYLLVRKDVRTGEIILVSRKEDGSPLRADWRYSAIGWDGTAFAYSTGDSGLDPADRGALFHHDLESGVRRIATMPERWVYEVVDLSADGRWLTWAGLDDVGSDNQIKRHDLVTGETSTLIACDYNWVDTCWRSHGPAVSDDGNTMLFRYREKRGAPTSLTVLDATTGTLTALPENGSTFTLSPDGAWVFYVVQSGQYRFELKKVSTTPGAVPAVLRTWEEDSTTWYVGVSSANPTGRLVGHTWSDRNPDTFAQTRALIHDRETGEQITLPAPRPGVAFALSPNISHDSKLAVVDERCPWVTDCGPLGTYAVSLRGLLPGHN